MATLLRDKDFKAILGKIIVNGSEECIRPNSYIFRLGSEGEFLNTGKRFELGKTKKGIKLQPGHSAGVTAFETLDISEKTVTEIFPNHALHGFLSPTTDLSREGIVAPATQVDAGYNGTLNWTLTNASSEERRFVFKERIFRLTLFKLEEGEIPERLYSGEYQSRKGYVASRRAGAPVGMKDSEWEDAYLKGGPENLLENLIKSGYPWNLLGTELKQIEGHLQTVTGEYAVIHDVIEKINIDVNKIREKQGDMSSTVRNVLREEANVLQNRWLIASSSVMLILVGIALSVFSDDKMSAFFKANGVVFGVILIFIAVIIIFILSRQKWQKSEI